MISSLTGEEKGYIHHVCTYILAMYACSFLLLLVSLMMYKSRQLMVLLLGIYSDGLISSPPEMSQCIHPTSFHTPTWPPRAAEA